MSSIKKVYTANPYSSVSGKKLKPDFYLVDGRYYTSLDDAKRSSKAKSRLYKKKYLK